MDIPPRGTANARRPFRRRAVAVVALGSAAAAGAIAALAAATPGEAGGAARFQVHRAQAEGPARVQAHRAPATVRLTSGLRHSPLRTSCRSVAHIGDSTSVDLVSAADIPAPAQRLRARYAQMGVRQVRIDASGGRSIVEALPGQVNGYDVARAWRQAGYRGCWVFALGTNDAANVAAGSRVSLKARIGAMMAVAHGAPVMWVNAVSRLTGGYWSMANERAWDHALVSALRTYPNMRIFNWAAQARSGWFLSDGIHYNRVGCQMRAEAIAKAVARAFPMNGRGKGQIVS